MPLCSPALLPAVCIWNHLYMLGTSALCTHHICPYAFKAGAHKRCSHAAAALRSSPAEAFPPPSRQRACCHGNWRRSSYPILLSFFSSAVWSSLESFFLFASRPVRPYFPCFFISFLTKWMKGFFCKNRTTAVSYWRVAALALLFDCAVTFFYTRELKRKQEGGVKTEKRLMVKRRLASTLRGEEWKEEKPKRLINRDVKIVAALVPKCADVTFLKSKSQRRSASCQMCSRRFLSKWCFNVWSS